MDNEYIKRLDQIQRDLNWVIAYLVRNQSVNPPLPSAPPSYLEPKKLTSVTCHKCGLVFDGVTSYYCHDNDCPIFTKVTF